MESKTQTLLKLANTDDEHSSVSFSNRLFPDTEKSEEAFVRLRKNLLNIDQWNKNSVISSYRLFDEKGIELQSKEILEGVFYRISLKGSGKYDWVKVVEIDKMADELVITVKPTYDPTAEKIDKERISHFFTDESSNNFCLLKEENSISLYVIGLQEKQNTEDTKNVLETIRNVATANIGSYLGIQKNEWETFCRNFLSPEIV